MASHTSHDLTGNASSGDEKPVRPAPPAKRPPPRKPATGTTPTAPAQAEPEAVQEAPATAAPAPAKPSPAVAAVTQAAEPKGAEPKAAAPQNTGATSGAVADRTKLASETAGAAMGPAATTAAAVGAAAPRSSGAKNPAASQPVAELVEPASPRRSFGYWLAQTPAWLASMVVHVLVLLSMALWVQETPPQEVRRDLVVQEAEKSEELEELEEEKLEIVDAQVLQSEAATQEDTANIDAMALDTTFTDPTAAAMAFDPVDFSTEALPFDPLAKASQGIVGGKGVEGRGMAARAALVKAGGGTDASERAVTSGVKWISKHQMPDGGWSFEHRRSAQCNGKCADAGKMPEARIAATALALLPFLGAGQTHRDGSYQREVNAGLTFLKRSMKVSNGMGSLHENKGSMYSHGLAAIALCEAYAMTEDKDLLNYAQASINFIVYAQDPVGGGWRYQPREPGDTSVVGWQIMALKSGHLGYLQVPGVTVKKAMSFLDRVQMDGGAKYGYTAPADRKATSAIGLLCRMHLGWKKEEKALVKGVEYLGKLGPSKNDMYYNYYATQVMRHYEGPLWTEWNTKMRDFLINSQSRKGHEDGSWYFPDGDGSHGNDDGGRLYMTALATMTLEVYYRHLPIYRQESSAEEFPD